MSIFGNRNGFYNRGMQYPPYPSQFGYPPQARPQHNAWGRRGSFGHQMGHMPQYPQMPQQNPYAQMPSMPQMPMNQMPHPHQMPSMPQQPHQGAAMLNQHQPPMPNMPQGFQMPQPQQQSPEYEIYEKIKQFAQGEANALLFYEALASNAGAQKEHLLELVEQKRIVNRDASNFYKIALGATWNPEEVKIEGIQNFNSGLKFALSQEARLLREALQIYTNIKDEAHKKTMNFILFNKVADIAVLSTL